jgi:hypothetical protein
MLTTKSKLVLLGLLFPFTLLAGNLKLHPGYYLNQHGDTVKCNIELGDWNRNPSSFHVAGSDGSQDFGPQDTKGFGVYDYADYVSAQVTYHSATTAGTNFTDRYSDKVDSSLCFLKLLTRGMVDLYVLETNQRTVYFISTHGSAPVELVYRVAMKDNALIEDRHYQQTLQALFDREGMGTKYEGRIEQANYNERDLISLVKLISGNNSNPHDTHNKKGDFKPYVFAGGQASIFPSSFDGAYSTNNHFSPSASLLAGIGLLYNLSPNSGKFKLGLSVVYSSYNISENKSGVKGRYFSDNFWDTTTYTEHIHSSNAFVTGNFFFMYVLNPDATLKYYLKAGTWYSFSVKNHSDIYSDYTRTRKGTINGLPPTTDTGGGEAYLLGISKSFGNILAGAGVSFGKNQVELAYSLPSFTGRFNGTGTKFKIGSVSLTYGYLFGGTNH